MDKFEKHSIYNITFELENEDGTKDSFEFRPLPWKHFPKVFKVVQTMTELTDGMDEEEKKNVDAKKLFSTFDEETTTNIIDLEKVMVSTSYPEKKEEDVEKFVISNMFELIEPLINLSFKQQKANPRKAEQGMKNV
ncbi:hypothetical protein [uncultured Arcobacter sp.]|uniref:hypothetical protein n=1 Tax=uncultured Arcobacter sp. TaxID=165434 RepID=UPI00263264C9|nr:hypothetical protein [uncultured Arcobacter sp.]